MKKKNRLFLLAVFLFLLGLFPAIRLPVSAAITASEWTYDCGNVRRVDIVGAGMGNETGGTNPRRLNISSSSNVEKIIAQQINKYQPMAIRFTSSAPQSFVLMTPTYSGGGYYYEQDLLPASWIQAQVSGATVMVGGSPVYVPRAFVGYVIRQTGDDYSTGKLPHKFVYWDISDPFAVKTWTETLTIPATTEPSRNISVTFAIADKRNSARDSFASLAVLTAEAGGVQIGPLTFQSPNSGDELLLYTIILPNVPGNVTTVKATVTSPDYNPLVSADRGDSLFWAGVNASTSCTGAIPTGTPTPTPTPAITCDKTYPYNKFRACYYQYLTPPFPPNNPDTALDEDLLARGDEPTSSDLTPPVKNGVAVDSTNPLWGGASCSVNLTGQPQASAVWRGNISFERGYFTFYTNNTYGVKVTVQGLNGGLPIIDQWSGSPGPYNYQAAPISIDNDESKQVTLQWYHNQGATCPLIKFGWDYMAIPNEQWFQVVGGGDVHAQGNLYSNVHPDSGGTQQYFSLTSVSYPAGLVSLNGRGMFSQLWGVSEAGWLLSDPPEPYSYDAYSSTNRYDYGYFEKKIPNPQSLGNNPTIDDLNRLGSGYYKVEGELTLPDNTWTVTNQKKIVILVDGNLNIKRNIFINNPVGGNFLAIIVKENIIIDPAVGRVAGIYIANGQISTVSGSNRLRGMGAFVAYGDEFDDAFLLLRRTSVSNPAELFMYDVNLVMQAPSLLWSSPFVWEEVAP